jgi:hypothetical protein
VVKESPAQGNFGGEDFETWSTKDKRIQISIERCRARQFDLSVNGLSYGEYMHLGNAKMLAEFAHGLLLDLQLHGILSKEYSINLLMKTEPNNADVSGNVEEAVRAEGTD